MGETRRRVTAAVTKLLLGSGAAAVLGFVTTAVAARALGPDGYGNVVVVRSFAAAVAAFASFQTPVAIIRFGAAALAGKSTPRLATLVRGGLLIDTASALVGGVAGAVVGWALIPTLGLEPAVRPWLFVYLVGVPLVVQGVPSAVLRLYDRYSAYAAVLVICAAGRLALVGVAAIIHPSPEVLLAAFLVPDLTQGVVLLVIALRTLSRNGVTGWLGLSLRGIVSDNAGIRELMGVTNAQATVKKATSELDVVVVAAIAGTEGAALFKIAKQFGLMSAKVLEPLYQVVLPEAARLAGVGRYRDLRRFSTQMGMLGAAVAAVPLAAFLLAPWVTIDLTVGREFRPAVVAIACYLGASVLAHGTLGASRVLLVTDRPRYWLAVTVPPALVYLGALAPTAQAAGVTGASVAYLVHNLFVLGGLLIAAHHVLRMAERDTHLQPDLQPEQRPA